jgi:hypothetical protein
METTGISPSSSPGKSWQEETKMTHDDSTIDLDGMDLADDVEIHSQDIRIKKFGIGCYGPSPTGDGIFFKAGTWKPGGEYIQKLIVRNVSTTVKKLKYKLPTTRFFSLAYPEVIVLSPGMSTELDVIFRPVSMDPYDDTIFIRVLNGSGGFHVSVKATIDKLIVSTPFGVDLGFCPTYQTTSSTFILSNDGEVDAPFRWKVPKGFELEPSEGIVRVGEKVKTTVSVVPTEANVLVGQAVCHIGEGVHALIPEPIISTRLSAIGKYAYISLSDPVLKWGEVLTGTSPASTRKEFVLRNTSVVPAEFSIIRHESDGDEVFDVYPREGVVPPQSEVVVTATYTPLGVGVYSLDRYSFITPGDCRAQLELSGTSMHAKVECFKEAAVTAGGGATLNADGTVSFSEASPGNSLNFRDVEIGHSETRILMIKNSSNKDVHFSVVADQDGTFKMKPRQGVIKASGPPFAVVISFSPHEPINYYRRVWITTSDRMPLFYDAMGSGYIRAKGEIKEQRPAPIRHAHVQAYRNRAVAGMGCLNPDEMDRMYNEGMTDPAFFALVGKTGTRALSMTTLSNPLSRVGDVSRVDVAAAHEMFITDTDLSCRDITVEKTSLDFGYSVVHKTSDTKTITVSNNSNGKVAVTWHVPRAVTEDGVFQEPVFSVSPTTVDINAGQQQTFKVNFRPFQTDRNFMSELEMFAYFKNQRTFRLVNDTTLTPPWCVPIKAVGHTFSTGQLLASVKFSGANVRAGKLTFPTCFEGETLYQPVVVKNPTNLPCTFKFDFGFGEERLGGPTSDDVFSVWPTVGEINAESFVVVYVRFVPTHSRKYLQLLKCIVNGAPSAKLLLEGNTTTPFLLCPDITPTEPIGGGMTTTISTNGVVLDTPGITTPPNRIENGPVGSFFLKPTCVGLSTSRTFSLKNGSRLPLRFRMSLPPEAEGILTVTPASGLLRGNEIATLTIAFAPREAEKYTFKLKAQCYPIGGRADRVVDARQPMGTEPPECLQNINIFVVAPGELGAVQFDPPRVSMDVRLVNTTETKDVYLENVSDCDLKYKLVYREEFLKDTGSALTAEKAKEDTVVSDMRELVSVEARDAAVKAREHGGAKGNDDDDLINESLLCVNPEGTLRARSRLRCPIVFQPAKAGLFDFFMYCQLEIINPHQQDSNMMLPNEEVALLRVNQSDRESYMAGQGISALTGIPLSVCITSRATFPKITIEDVRLEQECQVGDVSHLWRNMSLSRLNTDLSKPLTDSEFKLNLSSSPNLSQLKRYKFEFVPNVVGSPLQEVTFKFKNNGHLTTRFHLHLPNEKELELEQWCDEDEPSEELYKIISMIEELKLFRIEPAHGVLEPGESCDLTISYSHSYLKYGGVHNLPVHVKLEKGKQFFIDLSGRTLPSPSNLGVKPPKNARASTSVKPLPLTNVNAPPPSRILLTACVGETGIYSLEDVPIGLASNEAPLQRMELINPSAYKASYEIDMRALDALIEENRGSPIMRVANPVGVVEGGKSVFIDWYFYPLEVKTYSVPIKIRYEEAVDTLTDAMPPKPPSTASPASNLNRGPSSPNTKAKALSRLLDASEITEISFTLSATGYDPRDKDLVGNYIDNRDRNKPKIFGLLPPLEQLIVFDKQLASISHDVFDLNIVPQNSKCSRLLIIRNLNDRDSIDFTIEEESSQLVKNGQLSIYPTSGKLEPKEHVVVDFSFYFNTKAMSILDRIKITTREIVKVAPKRRGAQFAKDINKVIAKTEDKEHESVIKRVTKGFNQKLQDFEPAEGKSSSMPSTVNQKGEVILGVKYGYDPLAPDVSGGGGGAGVNTIGFEGSLAQSMGQSTFSLPADGIVGVGEEGLSKSMTGTMPTGRGDKSPNGSKSSRSMMGSSSMRRSKSEEQNSALRGKSNCFILRLRGMVMPYETLCALFKERRPLDLSRPLKDSTFKRDFFVPPAAKFICPITANTFSVQEPEEPPSKVRMANIFAALGPAHQFEVRSVSEMVITDLFRSLLDSEEVVEYAEQVVADAASRDLETARAQRGATGTLEITAPLDEELQIAGNPVYGMYIDEIKMGINASAAAAAATDMGTVEDEEENRDDFDAEIPLPTEPISASSAEAKVGSAIRNAEFVDIAAEILRNTMFNLMQEVSYSEFPVDAEPLSFMLRE